MKIKLSLLLFFTCYSIIAQVGIGTTNPHVGAILDLTSIDKSLLVPRVANTAAITSPTNGMIIYDLSSTCFKAYQNNTWSDCLGNNGALSTIACASTTNSGPIIQGVNTTSVAYFINYTGGNGGTHAGQTVNSTGVTGLTAICNGGTFANGNGTLIYTIVGTAATSGTASFALNIGGQTCTLNVTVVAPTVSTLDCAGATHTGTLTDGQAASGVYSTLNYTGGNAAPYTGQTVNSTGVTGLTATLSAGTLTSGAGSLVYTISGTPVGNGTANFAITFGGQTCTLTRSVNLPIGALASLNCSSATITGALASGTAASGVSASVPYTGGNGGTHSGQTVTSTGVTGLTATFAAGTFAVGAGNASYTITGTPASTGTASFALNIGGQTCTLNITVYPTGNATFTNATNNAYVFSVNDTTLPLNSQGTLAIGTTINAPYTSGSGSYGAYTSPDTPISAAYCEDGASDWTFAYSYSAGTFAASGNLTITIITKKAGVITAWQAKRVALITTINFNFVNLPLIINGVTKPNTVGIDEGGDAIRGAIAAAGNASGTAYDSATVDNAVPITLAEYNQLLSTVPGALKKGANSITSGGAHSNGSGYLGTTTSGVYTVIGANEYVAGVAICPPYNYAGTPTNFKVVVSTGNGTALTCLNATSPSITGWTVGTYRYFAIKRPSTHSGTGKTYMGFIWNNSTDGNTYEVGYSSTGTTYYGLNATVCGTYTGTNHSYTPALQIICTSQKSW